MAGEGEIPDTLSKVVALGETSEGERLPLLVDSQGRLIVVVATESE